MSENHSRNEHSPPHPDPESQSRDLAAALAGKIAAGSSDAEGELVEQYGQALRFLLRRLTRDPEFAEDIFQETFFIVIERLRKASLDDPAGLPAFIRGTARNLIRNAERKIKRQRTDVGLETPDGFELPAHAKGPGPLENLLRDEKAALVRRLIDEMRIDRDRQILYRFYLAEEPIDVISKDLGVELEQFYRILYRARQRLKTLIAKNPPRSAARSERVTTAL